MQHEAYSIILYLWLQENTKYCSSSTYRSDFDSLIRSRIRAIWQNALATEQFIYFDQFSYESVSQEVQHLYRRNRYSHCTDQCTQGQWLISAA